MSQHPSLRALYTALVDATSGYLQAVEDTESSDMRALFQEMIALHDSALVDLHPELEARGEEANDEGSFMSTVNEAIVSIRSLVTDLNENALPAFARGEERILNSYDKAIEEAAGEPSLIQTLERHREALSTAMESMKSAADQA
jgi:uncharacterized protein (TIGR02284 family)